VSIKGERNNFNYWFPDQLEIEFNKSPIDELLEIEKTADEKIIQGAKQVAK
jgi:hypothetical protein